MGSKADTHIDVIEVLLKEYKLALARKGLRRRDIDTCYKWALRMIDEERRNPTGRDIVDMTMDDATTKQFSTARPFHRVPSAPTHHRRIVGERAGQAHGGSFRTRNSGPWAKTLRAAKRDLQSYYAHESIVLSNLRFHPFKLVKSVQNQRAVAERRYVNALIKYCRTMNTMDSETATELQSTFTREKMKGLGASAEYLLRL